VQNAGEMDLYASYTQNQVGSASEKDKTCSTHGEVGSILNMYPENLKERNQMGYVVLELFLIK
jgi:hypothetical protein